MPQRKTVIITGASSGIGFACFREFYDNNWNVVLAARSIDKMEEAVNQLDNSRILVVQCDVTKPDDCCGLVEKTLITFSKIDCLINNAGISMRALFNGINLEVLQNVMNVNFWGMVYCTHAALPHIIESQGTVVGVSSIAGYRGLPARTGYSASKFAMNGFLESLRSEELHSGINVLTVCPGFTSSNIRNTALTADGSQQGESPREESKMMTSEQVASKIYKGVLKRKRTIVMTTEGKLAVFLNKFFPKLMDKIVYNQMAKEKDSPFKNNKSKS